MKYCTQETIQIITSGKSCRLYKRNDSIKRKVYFITENLFDFENLEDVLFLDTVYIWRRTVLKNDQDISYSFIFKGKEKKRYASKYVLLQLKWYI